MYPLVFPFHDMDVMQVTLHGLLLISTGSHNGDDMIIHFPYTIHTNIISIRM